MGYVSDLQHSLPLPTPPQHLNWDHFWLKEIIDMIHSFDLFKRFFKNIKWFFSSFKNSYYYMKVIFRCLGAEWHSFVFCHLEICPGHMTIPVHRLGFVWCSSSMGQQEVPWLSHSSPRYGCTIEGNGSKVVVLNSYMYIHAFCAIALVGMHTVP